MYKDDLKGLQYFGKVRYNLAVLDAFAEVVKGTHNIVRC